HLPAGDRRLSGAQGPGRRQVADVGGTDPPDFRDAGELAAGGGTHPGPDDGRGLRRAAFQPHLQPQASHGAGVMAYPHPKPWMGPRDAAFLADILLYVATAAVLVFFYNPIFTLIAFSLQEGRFLTLPFEGISLRWYGELFRN